ncbi:MAG: DUF222 domain-containing protein [Marmoricola sp.]|nr:DUF222 domain-containing protein [Marmoricola sp.]
MSTTALGTATHPVAVFAERLNERLDDLAEQSFLSMTDDEVRESLIVLARARAKEEALHLRLLAEADTRGVCLGEGAPDAAGWMRAQTQQTRRDAKADLTLARRLEDLPVLAAGMAAGRVNTTQARAVIGALDRLPCSGELAVSLEQRRQAEQHLVDLCAIHDARDVAALGRRVFEVIAPDAAEEYEGRLLAAEEAKAERKTFLELWTDAQGVCHGRFAMPARFGDMLRKASWSLTNPVRPGTTEGSPIDPDLPGAVRQGIAFTQLIEAIDAHWLPTHGGVGATVVVLMTKDQLLADLDAAGVCATDMGGTITAAEARRLACSAGILPMVLGGKSLVLDAGMKKRFATEPMRIAMALRDKTCTAEGCDVPASMCHAHHDIAYSHGGPTSVNNGRLLCGHHHRRIHDPHYEHEKLPTGKVRFHRRT